VYRIRRFGIMKTALVAGLMYVTVFLIGTVLVALLVAVAPSTNNAMLAGGVAAVLVGGIVISLVYGVIGFVFTAIVCAVYNVVAGQVGGIEVQVESVLPPAPPPTWGPITSGGPTGTPGSPPPAGTPPPAAGGQAPWNAPTNATSDTAPYDPGSAPRND
jgi:hypothetical protein